MQNCYTVSSQMELRSLQHSSSPLTTLPTSLLFRSNLLKRQLLYGQFIKFSTLKKYPCATSLQNSHIRAQLLSGATRVSSSIVEASTENVGSKSDDIVFVAGATGKVGSRTVRELLKLGCQVRAGVRSAQRAESLVQSVRQMKVDTDAASGRTPIEMLEIVECDLEKPDQIFPALGKASVVICCIGASEKEIFDVTGPYRIDFLATKNLIEAATAAKVNHFLLVTSLGTNKFGFPAAILNLFWGVLCWKRKAEEALLASGLSYTIVRPGGMERPTDSFKETHNLTLAPEDSLFGGLVSNLQVAELLAFMVKNRNLSYCKILEVVAETTAPLTPMEDLLVKIPSKRKDLQKVKEKDASSKPLGAEPAPARSFISEVQTVQGKSNVSRPLSPYTMYDDLKPPSSPWPSAPSGQEKQIVPDNTEPDTTNTMSSETQADTSEEVTVELQKMQPLSPYTAYEDLKPPTSPTPSAPNSSVTSLTSASAESQLVNLSNNGAPEPSEEQNADDERTPIQPKPRPLSPYTMYDDMKPPISPTPSPPGNQ